MARRRSITGDGLLEAVVLPPERVADPAAYPWALPAVRALAARPLRLDPRVTVLVGENGAGKSTLLEAIAVAAGFNAEGGTRNFDFETRRSHSPLCDALVLEWARRPRDGFFFRGESFFNVATEVEKLGVGRAYGERSLHEQSHGEAFLSLVNHRFGPDGLYLLDEPEQALAPQRQLSLLAALHALVRRGSQFVLATHSPILMAFPGARLLAVGAGGLTETTWEATEHVQVYRGFLNDPARWLGHLVDAVEAAAGEAGDGEGEGEGAGAAPAPPRPRRPRASRRPAPEGLVDPELAPLLRPRRRRRPPLEVVFEPDADDAPADDGAPAADGAPADDDARARGGETAPGDGP